jgi:hypothetical protein
MALLFFFRCWIYSDHKFFLESSCDNPSQLPATLYPEVSEKEILTTKLFKTFMNIAPGRNLEKHPGKLLVLCTFSIKSRKYSSKEM